MLIVSSQSVKYYTFPFPIPTFLYICFNNISGEKYQAFFWDDNQPEGVNSIINNT